MIPSVSEATAYDMGKWITWIHQELIKLYFLLPKITSSAISVENIVKMRTFPFQGNYSQEAALGIPYIETHGSWNVTDRIYA